ncbi:glycoside hydrolase N-terminal domain-containing protein [Cnuibacter physcomitrellae]|uniref:glycosyl hydrolase family 95 catalytic domain-containing protein n=1 Tax=Cnuibacter physcomitrellae TaxID=1619308 RepID=UPI002175CD9F|nr:glycoside hydrolase N-terminal domain-containing protein [Cnuibacter physcomitrellae]MCS5497761.1 glycoside hydrolase N-terminal domain-containing protein [Cnuibacter physcomitrellae]
MHELDLDATPRPEALRVGWSAPADEWVSGAPLGNGRTGAMVTGSSDRLRLSLNDSAVWSGSPSSAAHALDEIVGRGAGPERLAAVRAALDRGDRREAERLLLTFEGPWSQEFLPLGELLLVVSSSAGEEAGEGRVRHLRELDLDDAVVRERLGGPGQEQSRTIWASAPASSVLVHVAFESAVDLELSLGTPLRLESVVVGPGEEHRASLALGVHVPTDGAPLHEEAVAEPHVYGGADAGTYDAYAVIAAAVRTDGRVSVEDQRMRIRGARRVLVSLTTDGAGRRWWRGARPEELTEGSRSAWIEDALRGAEDAVDRAPQESLRMHLEDVRPLLAASTLTLGGRRSGLVDVPTEVLRGEDDALTATVLHQLGRYLLVAASRPGSPPANLQGIWNADLRPPWSSNYTININTQMNYWAAESSGLSECHEPLLELVRKLSVSGAETARRLYGTRGWVAHHNTDMWGYSLPVGAGHGNPSWAIWMMGGLWLTDHVWQHWAYTLDDTFLRERGWPVLVGAAEFALDWLVEEGAGRLRTIPSTSPENLFRGPDGHAESLTQSTAMDVALIRALFLRVQEASAALGLGHPVLDEIAVALPRLPDLAVTTDGLLREWGEDVAEVDPVHRHVSPLIAVYPLGLIDPVETPALARAAVATLDRRGPGAMGWSWAWKIALRARLGDGESARALFKEAAAPLERDHRRRAPVDGSEWGGLLPNLFSTHPPFQIDGNYGFAAALRETVLGTRSGEIRLLPALPRAWAEGEILGARVPGALEVDLRWEGGRPVELVIRRRAERSPREVVVSVHGERMSLTLAELETRLGPEELAPLLAPLMRRR